MQFNGLLPRVEIFVGLVSFLLNIRRPHVILFIRAVPSLAVHSASLSFAESWFFVNGLMNLFIHLQILQFLVDVFHLVISWKSVSFALLLHMVILALSGILFLGKIKGRISLHADLIALLWIIKRVLNLGTNWFWRVFRSRASWLYLFFYLFSSKGFSLD